MTYTKFQDSDAHYSELFRAYDQLSQPDGRWTGYEQTQDQFKQRLYSELSKIVLLDSVPRDVYINLETVKNCMMYSFFCYRLSAPAIAFALSTLEMAIFLKAQEENIKFTHHDGLKKKLTTALDNDWIQLNDVEVPRWPNHDPQYFKKEVFLPWIVNFRNGLAHYPTNLQVPWQIVSDIRKIALLINQLFQNKVLKEKYCRLYQNYHPNALSTTLSGRSDSTFAYYLYSIANKLNQST